jgi:hypothetical protein
MKGREVGIIGRNWSTDTLGFKGISLVVNMMYASGRCFDFYLLIWITALRALDCFSWASVKSKEAKCA